MSHDYGPLRSYEITWRDRAPEVVRGHQVLFGSSGFTPAPEPSFRIHGEFDGDWRLVLMGLEQDVACIRDVTDDVAALEAIAQEEQP